MDDGLEPTKIQLISLSVKSTAKFLAVPGLKKSTFGKLFIPVPTVCVYVDCTGGLSVFLVFAHRREKITIEQTQPTNAKACEVVLELLCTFK